VSASKPNMLYYSYKMSDYSDSVKRVAILGSTGSIGRQTLEIVRALPEHFKIVGLAAGENLNLLQQQVAEFHPYMVSYLRPDKQSQIAGTRLISMEEMASHEDVDILVIATAGQAGLNPIMSAIKADKVIALANKEPLVTAGEIIMDELKKHKGSIVPVDSEHSAIWQCMSGESQKPARLILTASGGPFLRYSADQMANISVDQALKHPSWKMGRKVTIDSATLMNKGLEVIEAHWLFDMPFEQIDILIHPQSIVHSMIEMVDGSFKAQLSSPDMRLPIQFALTYPKRLVNNTLPKLKRQNMINLTFEQPDYQRFPCLQMAINAGKQGGTYPAVLCAADEETIDWFLKKQIQFSAIPIILEKILNMHDSKLTPNLEDIAAADIWAREQARNLAAREV
jgi:1-deoxy-D-xylulose-5-phosphate reductoisomerase